MVGTSMNAHIRLDMVAVEAFCRKWRIRELSLFGSALRPDFGPESDVDFLVSFERGISLQMTDLLDMKDELSAMLGRPVDLVEREALRNPWRKRHILRSREIVYAA